MKKVLSLVLVLMLFGNVALASNYTSIKNYKLNQYNSKGQKVGYTKVYYQGEKQNVKKVEKYSTNGKRIEVYK